MNELMNTILHRRAIRRYEEAQIEEDVLQQILQAGLYAPSAGGRQGVIFAISQNKSVNERLGRIKRANSNPKMATETSYVSKEQPSIADDPNIEDCAVAAENMMLVADCLGVGSCYIGAGWTAFADPFGQEILQEWGIDKNYYAVMQLLLGYPKKDDKHPIPKARREGRVLRF